MRYLWTLILGMFLGAAALSVWQRPDKVDEAPAVADRQADGSLALERKPGKVRPKQAIPKGGKAERVVSVDVQPDRADCPVCTVDLTLVRMPDETRRVIASSPTGTVLGGLDVPIAPLNVERDHPWAAGISRGTGEEAWGAWLDRDFDFLRIGGEFNKISENSHESRYEARLKIGLRF